MGELEAFLRRIKETPEDDLPRPVFADCLEENGQVERGEFLRLQCRWARLRDGEPGWYPLWQRIRQLIESHGNEWLDSLAPLGKGVDFHLGLIYLGLSP
jgi:uncharacterized protein (TIGR02996 family)